MHTREKQQTQELDLTHEQMRTITQQYLRAHLMAGPEDMRRYMVDLFYGIDHTLTHTPDDEVELLPILNQAHLGILLSNLIGVME